MKTKAIVSLVLVLSICVFVPNAFAQPEAAQQEAPGPGTVTNNGSDMVMVTFKVGEDAEGNPEYEAKFVDPGKTVKIPEGAENVRAKWSGSTPNLTVVQPDGSSTTITAVGSQKGARKDVLWPERGTAVTAGTGGEPTEPAEPAEPEERAEPAEPEEPETPAEPGASPDDWGQVPTPTTGDIGGRPAEEGSIEDLTPEELAFAELLGQIDLDGDGLIAGGKQPEEPPEPVPPLYGGDKPTEEEQEAMRKFKGEAMDGDDKLTETQVGAVIMGHEGEFNYEELIREAERIYDKDLDEDGQIGPSIDIGKSAFGAADAIRDSVSRFGVMPGAAGGSVDTGGFAAATGLRTGDSAGGGHESAAGGKPCPGMGGERME